MVWIGFVILSGEYMCEWIYTLTGYKILQYGLMRRDF